MITNQPHYRKRADEDIGPYDKVRRIQKGGPMNKKIFAAIAVFCAAVLGAACLLTACAGKQETEREIQQNFEQTVEKIRVSFSYPDYEEVMGEQSQVLLLPMEKDLVDDDDNFIVNQKLFVYKSAAKNTIIMVQVMPISSGVDQWDSTFSYSPENMNRPDSTFGSSVLCDIPDITLAAQSFSLRHCHYNIVCFSPNLSIDSGASVELTAFNNAFLTFLAENM